MSSLTQKRRIGNIGEELASRFLVKHGFEIVTRNYLKKFGEIDIISKKGGILHFVEVKTVSRETRYNSSDQYRPEDNVHQCKLTRIGRTIQSYLLENNIEGEWVFDLITVLLDSEKKIAQISIIEDLIIES